MADAQGKFGALLASIPFTIFAAAYCILFGLVAAVGLSFLQFTNMNSMTNHLSRQQEKLKPLTLQLARVKDISIPEFGTLQAWEARANAAARLNGDSNANDSSKSSQAQGYGGTPMPFLGETKVEVALAGVEAKEESTETDTKAESMKVLPPWMIKQGMNLTKEQRGVVKAELKIDEISQPADEKKPKAESEDEKSIQDEYIKAYYAALVKRQEEQVATSNRMQQAENINASTSYISNGVSEAPSVRQVGMKAKREEDENDDVDWEEAPPAGKTFKVADLNVQADADEPADEEEDDIDWEEG